MTIDHVEYHIISPCKNVMRYQIFVNLCFDTTVK